MTERAVTFEDALVALGFVEQGESRRGGRVWRLEHSRLLDFTLHDFGDEVYLTWRFGLGEFALERGFQIGAGETSFQELYPARDVRLAPDAEAVRAEVVRTLGTLSFDLADPAL